MHDELRASVFREWYTAGRGDSLSSLGASDTPIEQHATTQQAGRIKLARKSRCNHRVEQEAAYTGFLIMDSAIIS